MRICICVCACGRLVQCACVCVWIVCGDTVCCVCVYVGALGVVAAHRVDVFSVVFIQGCETLFLCCACVHGVYVCVFV